MRPGMDAALAAFTNTMAPHPSKSRQTHGMNMTYVEAHALAKLLNQTLNVCSSRNIQRSTTALIYHVLPFSDQRLAWTDYMISLSSSCKPRPANHQISKETPGTYELEGLHRQNDKYNVPSPALKRLHALYLAHNILLATQDSNPLPSDWPRDEGEKADIVIDLKDLLVRLFKLAATRGDFAADNVTQQLGSLLQLWTKRGVLDLTQLDDLKTAVANTKDRTLVTVGFELDAESDQKIIDARKAREEVNKWILPDRHGVKNDPNAPWHELPAGNLLHVGCVRGFPVRAAALPHGGISLRNAGARADKELQKQVTNLKNELQECFKVPDATENALAIQDIDNMGNIIWKDPERPTRNYWGFSLEAKQFIMENKREFNDHATGYKDVPPLRPDQDPFRSMGLDVQQRGRGFANQRGSYGGDNWRGGRGGGGGGWRGGGGRGDWQSVGGGGRGGRGGPRRGFS